MEQAALASMKKDSEAEKERQRTYRPVPSVAASTAVDPREEIRAQKRKVLPIFLFQSRCSCLVGRVKENFKAVTILGR